MKRFVRAIALSIATLFAARTTWAADYVIEITVDALGSAYVQALTAAGELPNFQRLQTQGAWTYNARTDYDHTVTLPNHVSIVTGRPVSGTTGHAWTSNSTTFYPADSTTTLWQNKGSEVQSVFNVASALGPTALVSDKIKLSLIDTSYNGTGGTHGTVDRITFSSIPTGANSANSAASVQIFVNQMAATPFRYSLVHIGDPDFAGSWGSTKYNDAVRAADTYLGQIFNLIDSTPALAGKTALIVTADHGGQNNSHSTNSAYMNYNIPFFVWGPGVVAGVDLYSLNSATRLAPGAARTAYTDAVQPIRNSDGANLALELLGLGAIPGSTINALQDLNVAGAGKAARRVIAYNAFNEATMGVTAWTPSSTDTELGFVTQTITGPVGTTNSLGTYDSDSSPRRLRIRGYEAKTTFDTVDLAGFVDVRASIDIQIANTTYETGDYFRVQLKHGAELIDLAYVTGTALNGLAKDQFLHYEVAVPVEWENVTVIASALTNSGAGDEIVNFDQLFITGMSIPEPGTLAALVFGGLALLARRRR